MNCNVSQHGFDGLLTYTLSCSLACRVALDDDDVFLAGELLRYAIHMQAFTYVPPWDLFKYAHQILFVVGC